MDAMHLRYALMVGAGLSLVGLGISGLLLSRAQTMAERRNKRLAEVVSPHIRRAQIELSAFALPVQTSKRSVIGTLSSIFGFDLEKISLYPTRWWIAVIGMLGLAKAAEFVLADFLGWASILALPVIWIMLSRSFFSYFETRRQQLLLTEFPDALAMVVRGVRVGIPVMEAIRNVSRECPPATAGEFGRLVDQVGIGVTLEDAVLELARRTGLPEYRFFATTLSLQNQTGGTLSDTLQGLADVIRKRAALKAKGRAMTSEARSSSMVLAVLPFITGLMLWIINPSYINVLFTDPKGKSMLGLAVIMLSAGVLSIHTIIKKTLP